MIGLLRRLLRFCWGRIWRQRRLNLKEFLRDRLKLNYWLKDWREKLIRRLRVKRREYLNLNLRREGEEEGQLNQNIEGGVGERVEEIGVVREEGEEKENTEEEVEEGGVVVDLEDLKIKEYLNLLIQII